MEASTPLTSTSQFIQADEDDDFDEDSIPGFSHPAPSAPAQDKGKGRAPEQLAPPSTSPRPAVSGNIGSSTGGSGQASTRQTVGGVRVETRFTGVDTLDEPIAVTIGRDLLSIYNKLVQVLYPVRKGGGREVLRDWDLWGPLILCLLLGIMLSVNAPPDQALGVFSSVVVLICVGSLVVTIQAKLLGGRVSFFQGLCVLGYCVAPLDVAAFISCFVRIIYVRAPIAILAWAWCIWASVNFLDGTKIEQQRILLAVYPLLFILLWSGSQLRIQALNHKVGECLPVHQGCDYRKMASAERIQMHSVRLDTPLVDNAEYCTEFNTTDPKMPVELWASEEKKENMQIKETRAQSKLVTLSYNHVMPSKGEDASDVGAQNILHYLAITKIPSVQACQSESDTYAEADQGNTFTLVECPSGTGQLIARLTDDEIDVAIALTDPLISGIAKGSKAYKLVGSYVNTPLNWAVITGKETKFNSIADLEGTSIGISRPGSGSQTMAYVMALQQGWNTDNLQFKVNNDIHGLIDSVNDGSTSAFMWEWFTTKPYADAGKVRFIGSVPTPWPSWLIAAHPSPDRAPPEALRTFLHTLSTYVRAFDAPAARETSDVAFIQEKFGYPEADIKVAHLHALYPFYFLDFQLVHVSRMLTVMPHRHGSAPSPIRPIARRSRKKVLSDTLEVLEKAGVIKAPQGGQFDVRDFVDSGVVSLI
ncbi:hypothetical protein EW146_g7754 [Bondarzewia mesenterica]|uniref:Uncharacterized protein n=1 Tax=Bondarzewia mesenterica TaxID=1095465 RepID=A0A4S4LJQ7_9AGAM|nr:hypothetical protein EW146_g7754 [Bondarzewia mesenterica]